MTDNKAPQQPDGPEFAAGSASLAQVETAAPMSLSSEKPVQEVPDDNSSEDVALDDEDDGVGDISATSEDGPDEERPRADTIVVSSEISVHQQPATLVAAHSDTDECEDQRSVQPEESASSDSPAPASSSPQPPPSPDAVHEEKSDQQERPNVAGDLLLPGKNVVSAEADARVEHKQPEVDTQVEYQQPNALISVATETDPLGPDEEKEKLRAEVKRLRQHLVQVEDNYTQEFVEADSREKQLRADLRNAEEQIGILQDQCRRAADNSTRAEQLDQLQQQLRTAIEQRDRALEDCSKLDDKVNQYTTSVTNLQLVIEQIQKESERKLVLTDEKHREQLGALQAALDEAQNKLRRQEGQLSESREALSAAGRLTEQIDLKEELIRSLRKEVVTKTEEIGSLVSQIDELKSSQTGKVDKQIMKSMVLGYFSTPPDKKHEVERLLARILDFSQEDMVKARLQISRNGPQQQQQSFASLSKQFVQFLETESAREGQAQVGLAKSSQPVRDLAKDLAKLGTGPSGSTVNPFLAPSTSSNGGRSSSASSSTTSASHSRHGSTGSANMLLAPQPVTPLFINSVPVPTPPTTSVSATATNSSLSNDTPHNNLFYHRK